ncbi:MAG: DNA internalization-related competence protein ComEC/Rec2, partial [Oceanidesulfovibrio sp.]
LAGFANNPDGDGYETYWRNKGVAYTTYAVGLRPEARLLSRGEALWETRLAVREKVFRHLIARGDAEPIAASDAENPARRTIVSPGGAMAAALLLGERYFLDAPTMELMGRADLRHTVALSGLHVACMALIGAMLAWLAGVARPGVYLSLPRPRLAALLACVLAVVYVWLGGGSPSLVRAAVMFLFFGALLWMGRRSVVLDGLLLALAVICLVSPLSVTDLRLVLSAASVAGIACILPFLPGQARRDNGAQPPRAMSWPMRSGRYLLGFFLVTIAVHLATMPIRIWFFGDVPVNPLANVIWLPLLGVLVMPVLVVGLALATLPWSWTWAQYAAECVLDLGASILDAKLAGLAWLDGLGAFPDTAVLRPTWPSWVGWWIVLLVALLWLERRRSGRNRLPRGWQILACAGLLLMVGPPVLAGVEATRSRVVSLTVLDVGQGQSLLIEGPGGVRALFDGGGFWSDFFDAGEHVVSPHLTRNRLPRLELAIMSHGDSDHLKGLLHPLSEFRVGGFVRNGAPVSSRQERERLAAILTDRELPVRVVYAGDIIELTEGLTLEAVHPDREFDAGSSSNDSSLALRLVWRGRPLALMPGDVEAKAVRAMVESGQDLSAQVLVAPHHGGKYSVDADFYRAVNPRLAVASVGRLNQWRLPSEQFVNAMRRLHVPVYTTAEHGAVTITWDTPDAEPVVITIRR